jgi:hypothetical protein
MDRSRRERREAHRDIFGPLRTGCAVPNPFTAAGEQGLACMNVMYPFLCFDPKHPPQHDGVLVKFRGLSGLLQPDGLCMRATLISEVCELTRPINSSMSFGLLPAARVRVGC